MRLYAIVFITFIAASSFSACSKNHPDDDAPNLPQSVDETQTLIAQIGGERLVAQDSSLVIGSDGSFEILYKPSVRYFPEKKQASDTQAPESDAICDLRITGQVAYYSKKFMHLTDNKYSASSQQIDFYVSKTEVLSSSVVRDDLLSILPDTVCQKFAAAILAKQEFEARIDSFSPEYVEISDLSFDFPLLSTDPLKNQNYLFQVEGQDGFGFGTFTRYYVKEGSKTDVTSIVLGALSGDYELNAPDSPGAGKISLSFNQSRQELVVSNTTCGTHEIADISAIYSKGGYLRIQGKPAQQVPPSAGPEQKLSAGQIASCDKFNQLLSGMTDGTLVMSYLDHVCLDVSCTSVYLDLGKISEPGQDFGSVDDGSVTQFLKK